MITDIFPADTVNVSDITDRVDELNTYAHELNEDDDELGEDDAAELAELTAVLEELDGNGGDHQWQGDWYPGELVHEDYWVEHAKLLAERIGAVDVNAGWPLNHVDREAAANELLTDYQSIDADGVTYWYR